MTNNIRTIGAINTQLMSCSWLDVLAIDVNSQHPRIQEIDFFDLVPTFSYDVVVCSMVSTCMYSIYT
jgi:25S rRNA (adenine2142-N1)-methyltransferase